MCSVDSYYVPYDLRIAAPQFHVYLAWVNTYLAYCLIVLSSRKFVSSSTWHSPLHVRQRGQTGVGVGAAIRLVAVLLCQQQTFQKRLKVLLLPHPRQLCCIAVAAAVSRLVLV